MTKTMTKITGISYSLSYQPATLLDWKNGLKEEIKSLIASGSDIIVYPELFLMGLTDYFQDMSESEQMEKVASFISDDLLFDLGSELKKSPVMIVLGTGPLKTDSKFYNSSPVFVNGEWSFQNKIYLTPWEDCFLPGESVRIFNFQGLKCAVVICFDIEQPYLAQKLKEEQVHLILSPSATTNKNGNQRVNRCASSRAVELGAAVLAVPVVGSSKCELVDYNEGQQGFFLPAQDSVTNEQQVFSEYSNDQQVIKSYEFDSEILKKLKERSFETRPFLKNDPEKLKIIS